MALLEIRKYPDPVLITKSKELQNFSDDNLRKITKDMIETMRENGGVGLAASQIGINKRFFVADIGQGSMSLINPKITKKSNEYISGYEGCLSLPELSIRVKRAKSIELKGYLLEKKQQVRIKAENLLARVFQHEIDHLNGVLIIDRVSFWQKCRALRKLTLLNKNL